MRLSGWLDAAVQWGPVVPAAIGFALALIEAVVLPARLWVKGICVVIVLGCGMLASADLNVQRHRAQSIAVAATQVAAGEQIAALHGLWSQWDALSQTLPPVDKIPPASFETTKDALASLSSQVALINRQINALKDRSQVRSIDDLMAPKLADYLHQFGSFPVVVSCVPNDVEAYDYANQIVNILRAAGWDAHGPEISAARSEAVAMGISVFVRDPRSPGAAKILLDGFTRFNVPFQSGITASEAILDNATVELFVARKP